MKELKYGSDYPNSCPPSEARPIQGSFYRFCSSEILSPNDCKTHVDLKASFPPNKLCEAKALSFFKDISSARMMQKKYKKKFQNSVLFEVDIQENWGIAMLEGSHLNLWEYNIDIYNEMKTHSRMV